MSNITDARPRGRKAKGLPKGKRVTVSVNISAETRSKFYEMAEHYAEQTNKSFGQYFEAIINNEYNEFSS
jgi:hypothetical protein